MTALLESYDLLKYAKGHVVEPKKTINKDGQDEPNPVYKAWVTRDKFTMACLMNLVIEEIGNNLLATKTSHEAWVMLATLFDSQTVAQEDFLDQQ